MAPFRIQQKVFTKIIATGSYLPEKILTNDDLSKFVDTSDEWIHTRSGIRSRHIAADGEQTSDLAVAAANNALQAAGLPASVPPTAWHATHDPRPPES